MESGKWKVCKVKSRKWKVKKWKVCKVKSEGLPNFQLYELSNFMNYTN